MEEEIQVDKDDSIRYARKTVTSDKDRSGEGGEYVGKLIQKEICVIEAGQWGQKKRRLMMDTVVN